MTARRIVPATLAHAGGTPYSTIFGDVYHSAEGGLGQARHVFLEGCGLPHAWRGREAFIVLETGFGTGLNFLATWQAWKADPHRSGRLHFLSVERHPFESEDLIRLHEAWPEFGPMSEELVARWPSLVPGFHRIEFDGGRVQLTLMLGDAKECLPQLDARVDAFYLDGFAPDRNPDLWTGEIFREFARLANAGARAATYSVAAPVRNGLAEAGFVCTKRPGYGRKRHCLTASYSATPNVGRRAVRTAAVIGAGVAGSAVAHALAKRGVRVVVFEREADVAMMASGNPAAVFRPVIARDEHPGLRLTRAAFLHDLATWPNLGSAVKLSNCGVLHLAKDANSAAKQRDVMERDSYPAQFARWVEVEEANALAHWPVGRPGVFFPRAGWIVPTTLCHAWLGNPIVEIRCGCPVDRLARNGAGWQLIGAAGQVLMDADAVILANARDAPEIAMGESWPIQTVRGQVTLLPGEKFRGIKRVIASEGYLSPTPGGGVIVGATYDHDTDDVTRWPESDLQNIRRLDAILPGAGKDIGMAVVGGRASLRAVLSDRLPLLGAVDGWDGLYVAAGYASRGVVWAGLLGETLASMMLDEPLPLERDLIRALSPNRFGKPTNREAT